MKKGLKQHRENYHKSIGQSELPTFFPSGTKYPDGVSDDEKPNKKPKKNKNKGKKQSTLEKTFGTGTGKDEDGDPAKKGDSKKKKGDPNPDPDTSEPTTDAITRKRKHSTLENSLADDHAKKGDPSSSNEGQQGETAENKPAKSSCVSKGAGIKASAGSKQWERDRLQRQ